LELDADDTITEDFADTLIDELDESDKWPLPREAYARGMAAEGRALRKGDREWLKQMHRWDRDRDYVVDSLAKRIAFGWADFLFAEDVTITAAGDDEPEGGGEGQGQKAGAGNTKRDVAQLEIDTTIETTRMPALLHRAERVVVSEGEAYWKLHVNRAVADTALLTWCSRLDTVPLFYGDRLLALAFVTERHYEIETVEQQQGEPEQRKVIYRHAEIHTEGRVVNVLYRGDEEHLGDRVKLDDITQTAGYAEEWKHGLPMLAGRVVNDLDDDDTFGVGEYASVVDLLLALNEAMTIAVENARLTGKDRIFSAGRFMQSDGSFDASLEVFQVETDGATLGEGDSKPPVVAIEKHYDAVPLWLHITNLVKTICNRVGLVPQWIGEDVEGHGETGLAIRLRFIPTVNAAKGKTREWAHVLPLIMDLMLRVASLPIEQGGFGREVAQDEPPAVEFADPIPADQSRDLLDVSAAVVSEVMSRRTAIKTLHPEWSDEQVDDELQLITKDRETEIAQAPPPPNPDGLLPAMPPGFKPVHPPAGAR
jgi:hypothetical protein